MDANCVQVFISSTWLDLPPEREEVETALRRKEEREDAERIILKSSVPGSA